MNYGTVLLDLQEVAHELHNGFKHGSKYIDITDVAKRRGKFISNLI